MKGIFCIILFFVFVSFCVCPCFAQEENLGFIVKGKYFSIYGYENFDIAELLGKINFSYSHRLDSRNDIFGDDPKSRLIKTIDALYLEVSDILGIHVYSFHGNINFYPNQTSLAEVFKKYFASDFPERSFYYHGHKTIYLSFSDLTLGMLGHEISHAIISHYFVVPPSPKVQEILCGYVEYSLRKASGVGQPLK